MRKGDNMAAWAMRGAAWVAVCGACGAVRAWWLGVVVTPECELSNDYFAAEANLYPVLIPLVERGEGERERGRVYGKSGVYLLLLQDAFRASPVCRPVWGGSRRLRVRRKSGHERWTETFPPIWLGNGLPMC